MKKDIRHIISAKATNVKTKQFIGNRWACPVCKRHLLRIATVIQTHLHTVHKVNATTAEVHRLLAPPGSRRIPYAEGLKRDPCLVSGGLPSLGKKR